MKAKLLMSLDATGPPPGAGRSLFVPHGRVRKIAQASCRSTASQGDFAHLTP
jgi:hypothetical protein